jgi:hypothetical protein
LQFEIQSFKRNTACCLIAHFVRNKWIATSVASLLPRNDEWVECTLLMRLLSSARNDEKGEFAIINVVE